MKKIFIGSVLATTLLYTGCIQKKSEESSEQQIKETQETQASVVTSEPIKNDVLPAMLAQSIQTKLLQARICYHEEELDDTVCKTSEVIGLKSNIDWIDQIIDQEIKEEFAENFVVASSEQKQLNQAEVEFPRNWSQSVVYRFSGQFGRYVQISKTSAEYSGGAHGMAYFTSYVFDLKNKKRMTLNDIVVSGKHAELKEKLWQAYQNWCQDNEMEPFTNKEDFTVSSNFIIQPNGSLTFDYQLYELAPYVAGPVSLDLYETSGLIKTDFLPETPGFDLEY